MTLRDYIKYLLEFRERLLWLDEQKPADPSDVIGLIGFNAQKYKNLSDAQIFLSLPEDNEDATWANESYTQTIGWITDLQQKQKRKLVETINSVANKIINHEITERAVEIKDSIILTIQNFDLGFEPGLDRTALETLLYYW